MGEGTFDHETGVGHVAAHDGDYHDALHAKGNTLLLLISEVFGGVGEAALQYLRKLAGKAGADGGVDKTVYDVRGRWRLSFFEHHARKVKTRRGPPVLRAEQCVVV